MKQIKKKEIEKIITDQFRKKGRKISDLIEMIPGQKIEFDKEMRESVYEPKWFQLKLIEEIVCEKLNINCEEYGKKRSHNNVGSMIRSIITEKRKEGEIIDLKFGIKKGTWRKTTKMEQKAIKEFNEKKFSYTSKDETYRKIKGRQFKNFLNSNYKNCLICRDDENFEAIPIIKWEIMKEIDIENYLNPSNGLVLCPKCKYCFEESIVEIEKDYSIKINEERKNQKNLSKHLEKIQKFQKIEIKKTLKPKGRYLQIKKFLK